MESSGDERMREREREREREKGWKGAKDRIQFSNLYLILNSSESHGRTHEVSEIVSRQNFVHHYDRLVKLG